MLALNNAKMARAVRILKAKSKFASKRNRRAYQTAHRVADGAVPTFVNLLLTELQGIRRRINVAAVQRAVAAGNVAGIEAALLLPSISADLRRKYRVQLLAVLQKAGVASIGVQPKRLAGLFGRFDLTNPRAVRWAASKSSELVREIDDSLKLTIRGTIADGIEDGVPVRGTARRLRNEIGLTRKQSRAVRNFRADQIGRGIGIDLADKRTDRFRQKTLRRRALTIARTETIAATFQGRRELWDQATDRGLIDPTKVKRKWITTPDDRVDKFICDPMDGQEVFINEPFVTPQFIEIEGPPAHPQCRCDAILVLPGPALFSRETPTQRQEAGRPFG